MYPSGLVAGELGHVQLVIFALLGSASEENI